MTFGGNLSNQSNEIEAAHHTTDTSDPKYSKYRNLKLQLVLGKMRSKVAGIEIGSDPWNCSRDSNI